MPHYASSFSINRLALEARLGIYDTERAAPQPVAVSLRLYFPEAPACAHDDHAGFIDYAALAAQLTDLVLQREFRLIEYMAQELFCAARQYVSGTGGDAVKIWLKLTKCRPDVPYLVEGASFTLSDLPAGATWVTE